MAPYTPNIQYPVFQPAMRTITAITNAFPAQVTTEIDHQYQTGLVVRILVPDIYGMYQCNGLFGTIEVTSATTFHIDLDTTTFDVFSIPDPLPQGYTNAQSVPIAESNDMLSESVQNVLPYQAVPL